LESAISVELLSLFPAKKPKPQGNRDRATPPMLLTDNPHTIKKAPDPFSLPKVLQDCHVNVHER
jgi:hypothetical protein